MTEIWLEEINNDFGGFFACSQENKETGPRFATEQHYLRYVEKRYKENKWNIAYLGIKDKEGKFSLKMPLYYLAMETIPVKEKKSDIPKTFLFFRGEADMLAGEKERIYRCILSGGVFRNEGEYLEYLKSWFIPTYIIGKAVEYLGIRDKEGKYSLKTPLLVTTEEAKKKETLMQNYTIHDSNDQNDTIPANQMCVGHIGTIMDHPVQAYIGQKVIMLGDGSYQSTRLQSLTEPRVYWDGVPSLSFTVLLMKPGETWSIIGK